MSAESLSSASTVAPEYQYNYSYVPPLAMAQGVPSDQEPTLEWWGQAIAQVLHIAHNRLMWVHEQSQRDGKNPPDTPALSVDLSHLGVGALDLTHLQKLPPPSSLAQKLRDTLSSLGEAAKLAEQVAGLTEKAFRGELGSVFDVLKTVLESLVVKPKGRPGSMQDYFNLFTTLPLPVAAHRYEDDATFAWMRVAGFNPLVLQQARSDEDTLGLGDAALCAVLGEGDSVRQALQDGRLYLADYKALARVVNGNFPDGPKYMFAPRALFGLPRGSGVRQLKALGIRCGQDPAGYPLYTPAEGEAWQQAKTTVSVADVTYHEMISHLGHTHLLVEPFVVATHRQLPEAHPVSVLLRPHFEGTLYINNAAQAKLIAPGGDVDMLLGGTIQSSRAVTVASLLETPDYDFTQGMLPRALEQRGVLNPDLDYPYRDDARLVWDAIEQWVRAYVGLHYADDAVGRRAPGVGRGAGGPGRRPGERLWRGRSRRQAHHRGVPGAGAHHAGVHRQRAARGGELRPGRGDDLRAARPRRRLPRRAPDSR